MAAKTPNWRARLTVDRVLDALIVARCEWRCHPARDCEWRAHCPACGDWTLIVREFERLGPADLTCLNGCTDVSVTAALAVFMPKKSPPAQKRNPRRAGRINHNKLPADDALASIPAATFVPALTGREPRGQFVRCPFHGDGAERTPSLHIGGRNPSLWHCFSCGEGGDIIGFGSRLWGIEPRGPDYRRLRARLAAELLARAA